MERRKSLVLLAVLWAGASSAAAQVKATEERADGYAEWRVNGCLLVDGQRVCPIQGARFKGGGEARDFASIPLGYEVKAKGSRGADGSLQAREVEARPNAGALFEGEVKSATDAAEQKYRAAGSFYEEGRGKSSSIGRLHDSGPHVERVRAIVDTLLPPYIRPEDVRVYVIENKEWNAFAMGNYSIYVFSGLLDDMDDDEVAIVLGHELVHASHEHTRRQFKKQMWIQLAALGVAASASTIDNDTKRTVVGLVSVFGAMAWSNGYGRNLEDQADRVGLRYAYEAGYDISKGPRLWKRFAKRYGEQGKVATFFFSDHSQSSARAAKLEKEIAFNYPDGPKPRSAERPRATVVAAGGGASATPVAASAAVPAEAAALVAPGAPVAAAPDSAPATRHAEIRAGMTPADVRAILGSPRDELVFDEKTRWTYPDLSVVFEKGKVKEVEF
jgi:Zn-dependent protease with chaperone function